jgi:hypothetical protein
MQAAMDATRLALSLAGSPNVDNLAMTVVVITGSEGTFNHPWAGLRSDETHYAASLVKIASMYAAFDLRSSADVLMTDLGLTSSLGPAMEAALIAKLPDPRRTPRSPGRGYPILMFSLAKPARHCQPREVLT